MTALRALSLDFARYGAALLLAATALRWLRGQPLLTAEVVTLPLMIAAMLAVGRHFILRQIA